jgi:hypothetical protein
MLELIRPDCTVLVLRLNQVAIGVVLIGTQLAQRFAVNDLPDTDKPPVIVDHRAEVQMDFGEVVFLIGDQVREHRVFAMTVLVMQHDPGAVAQRDIAQHIALATADVGFLALETTAQQQLVFAVADQGDVSMAS